MLENGKGGNLDFQQLLTNKLFIKILPFNKFSNATVKLVVGLNPVKDCIFIISAEVLLDISELHFKIYFFTFLISGLFQNLNKIV